MSLDAEKISAPLAKIKFVGQLLRYLEHFISVSLIESVQDFLRSTRSVHKGMIPDFGASDRLDSVR